MKKLLAILGALGITVSASTIVVACGTENSIKRFSTPVLTEELRDKILAHLLNDPDGSLSNLTNGKIFNELFGGNSNVVLKMLQDKISKLSNENFKNTNNEKLKLSKRNEFYQTQIDEMGSDIMQNQFYLQYTANIINHKTVSMDEELNFGEGNLYSLNPRNLLRNDNKKGEERTDKNNYFVYINQTDQNGAPTDQWVRWQYAKENDKGNLEDSLPTIEQLQNNQFIILRDDKQAPFLEDTETISQTDLQDKTQWFYKDKDGNPIEVTPAQKIYSKNGNEALILNGKTALEYRFQEYFTTEQEKIIAQKEEDIPNTNFFELLLTMSYLDNNFYNLSRNQQTRSQQDAFLNISSNLARTIQSWSKTDGYKSNLKMVWSFTFRDTPTVNTAWEKVGALINPDGSLIDNSQQTIMKLYRLLESAVPENIKDKNHSELGTDPFLNLNGYNGLVKSDGQTITSIDGNLNVNEEAKTKIAEALSPVLLTRDGKGQAYVSGTRQNEYDYYLVLPIYLIDLLNDQTGGFDNGQSTTAFAKLTDITNGIPSYLYSGYGKAILESSASLDNSKTEEIKSHLSETTNFYIYVEGVPYSLSEFDVKYQTNLKDLPSEELWQQMNHLPVAIEGLQFSLANTIGTTIGNIGINQKVNLGQKTKPTDTFPGIEFFDNEGDGNLYVTADASWIGKVATFPEFKLSFDDASKDGLITIQGNTSDQDSQNQGRTYSYKINLGPNGSDINGYVDDIANNFHYRDLKVSSLDIANLSTEKKSSLLRELEFITAKESGVADTAAGVIFPLFLENDQILFKPLYDSLKKYLIDEDGGTSD